MSSGNIELYVIVYVDDLVIGGNKNSSIVHFEEYLNKCFRMKNLEHARFIFLVLKSQGMKRDFFSVNESIVWISSQNVVSWGLGPVIPIEQNHRLALATDDFFSEPSRYRRVVGNLIYLTITRPKLLYVVHVLSQFIQSPRQSHWDAAMHVVRFLKCTPGQGLMFRANTKLPLVAFSDSD